MKCCEQREKMKNQFAFHVPLYSVVTITLTTNKNGQQKQKRIHL